jgi:hypothetical protein
LPWEANQPGGLCGGESGDGFVHMHSVLRKFTRLYALVATFAIT